MGRSYNLFRKITPPVEGNNEREEALDHAMDRYGEHMIRLFARATKDHQLAEDLASMLWVHVYEHFETYQFTHYPLLLRKAKQILCDAFRKIKTRRFVEVAEQLPDLPEGPRQFETPEEEARIKQRVWEMFEGAPVTEEQKEAIWLKVIHGYTLAEIAERMKAPVSTIYDWIERLKKVCRSHYLEENQ